MAKPSFQFINLDASGQIPIPAAVKEIRELEKSPPPVPVGEDKKPVGVWKHEKAYEDFCLWSAVPEHLRKPKTQAEFERRYKLPKRYCSIYFKKRDDFETKRKRYVWEWIRDLSPTFIHSQYLKAVKEGNPSSIKFFGEMVAKDMEVEKPKSVIQPFVIMGVPQEKINKLFAPDSSEEEEPKPLEGIET